MANEVKTNIAPWLNVRNSRKAVEFYILAFGAIENYRLDGDDDTVVSRLSINGAEFWVSEGEGPGAEASVRMILTVPDPDMLFEQAVKFGASVVYPVSESHGWRVGRIVDPYGHQWEIGREI
ncbi:MAG: glyoxalase [Bacteroidetes bacterium]|nr:MAG: glyoxalase [Bacteroidota bacterium]